MDSAFETTVRLSVLTASILSVVGIPLAWWITQSRRLPGFLGEVLVSMTLVLPPAVLGYFLLEWFSPGSFSGHLFKLLFGHGLPFSFSGLVVASLLYSLPFSVQPLVQAFRSIPKEYLENARLLRMGEFAIFVKIVLPLSVAGVLTAWVLSFAHTVGEFGVVLMVGGNIPGETRTLSIKAYEDLVSLDLTDAKKTVAELLALSFSCLLAIGLINRKLRG